ncbi:hypothetical protein AAG570_013102 [Ranatra chinensis]|uniref:Reverse transcriptase RNase H-like domain-containing protein n=1 Tax=Ranatra chinensis TaxID=642074 RepID=A0ABD0YGB6_9HEMI
MTRYASISTRLVSRSLRTCRVSKDLPGTDLCFLLVGRLLVTTPYPVIQLYETGGSTLEAVPTAAEKAIRRLDEKAKVEERTAQVLDEVVVIIREEEEDFKEERKNDEGWTKEFKHEPRRQEYRPQREYRPFPDFRKKFTLTKDASQVTLGAVLAHGEGLDERPVAFASRKLSPAETRYSTIERELLAIIWAIKNSKSYLLGRQFSIKTNHKPLVWVDKMEGKSPRISRWKEVLASYDYDIVHTKGKDNVAADCLSRQVKVVEDVDADYAARYLREWRGEAESETESEDPSEFTTPSNRNRPIATEDTIINNKRQQCAWEIAYGAYAGLEAF